MPLSLFFVFGLFLGSFLNTVALRLEKNEPIIFSRSKCPKCNSVLKWYNLVPILSFVLQKGKCANCSAKIPVRYPVAEIITGLFVYGIAKAIAVFNFQFPVFIILFFYYLIFLSCFFVLTLIDYKTKYIDERIIYFIAASWLIFQIIFWVISLPETISWSGFFNEFLEIPGSAPISSIFLAFLAALPFLFLFLITLGKGVGLGDAKVAFIMGLFLKPGDLILSLLAAIILGGITSIFILVKSKKFKQEIPYVPFLFFGTLITMFWGEKIISYYLKIFTP